MSTSPGSTLPATALTLMPEALVPPEPPEPGWVLGLGMSWEAAELDGAAPPEPRSASTAPAPTAAASTATST